jgi:hypothetical protein
MFNPLKMAGDMKGMEKMLKPGLRKIYARIWLCERV